MGWGCGIGVLGLWYWEFEFDLFSDHIVALSKRKATDNKQHASCANKRIS